MKIWLGTAILIASFSAQANTIRCEGKATVDNIGRVSIENVSVGVNRVQRTMIYHGPHASISLPTEEAFELPLGPSIRSGSIYQYYFANASRAGHGGEQNLFHLQQLESDTQSLESHEVRTSQRKFYYLGNYGYRVEGVLDCQITASL